MPPIRDRDRDVIRDAFEAFRSGDIPACVGSGDDQTDLKPFLIAGGLTPLMWDWSGVAVITLEGEIRYFAYESLSLERRLDSEQERRIALAQGARDIPCLLELIHCPSDAVSCPSCDGTGDALRALPPESAQRWGNIVCRCGGLGWIRSSELKPQ